MIGSLLNWSTQLRATIEGAIPEWVESCVTQHMSTPLVGSVAAAVAAEDPNIGNEPDKDW